MRFAVSARIAVVVAVLVLAGGNAAADTVKLNNGDRITGEIISIQEGKLILKTAYADELKIDRAVVVGITSDKDVTVWLASGDKITGKMEALEGGRVNVVTGSGAVSAAVTDVAGINAPPGGKTKSDLEAEIARLSSPSESWRGELGVGAYYTNGNSDRLGGWVRMELIREGAVHVRRRRRREVGRRADLLAARGRQVRPLVRLRPDRGRARRHRGAGLPGRVHAGCRPRPDGHAGLQGQPRPRRHSRLHRLRGR